MPKIDDLIKELEIKDKIITSFHINSDDKLFSKLLEIIIETTESEFAMLGFVVKKQNFSKKLHKEDIWDKYMMKEKLQIFDDDKWLDNDTIWSRTISTGLPQILNEPLEVDEGERPIHRVLSIPIKFHSEIIGIITTVNKKSDYDTLDIEHLEQFLKYVAPYLHKYIENKRLSEELKIRMEAQKKNIQTSQVIDEVDQQILDALISNGRKKISNMEIIQNKSKMSHTGVKKRINRLVEKKILKVQGGINPKALNLTMVIVRLDFQENVDLLKMIKFYQECPRVFLLIQPKEDFQLILGLFGKSLDEINNFININIVRDDFNIEIMQISPVLELKKPIFIPSNLFNIKEKPDDCNKECSGCNISLW